MTYQLVFLKKQVNQGLKDTLDNMTEYQKYREETTEKCKMGNYDTKELPKNNKLLKECEEKIFTETLKKPITVFSITVKLTLTQINERPVCSKQQTFFPKEIKDIIYKLNQKRGSFYLNPYIWSALCRVERGKVTNRTRFAIYKRDNYQCQICGRHANDLEIDHIIPIAKGSKSTMSNLQIICHRCNVEEGDDV